MRQGRIQPLRRCPRLTKIRSKFTVPLGRVKIWIFDLNWVSRAKEEGTGGERGRTKKTSKQIARNGWGERFG